jgi:hypothetical protein
VRQQLSEQRDAAATTITALNGSVADLTTRCRDVTERAKAEVATAHRVCDAKVEEVKRLHEVSQPCTWRSSHRVSRGLSCGVLLVVPRVTVIDMLCVRVLV